MNSRADRNTQAGFSVIELLIVISIMVIMTAVAIFAMIPHKSAYRTDDEALQILGMMRLANQRALTQRQPQRLEIDLTDNVVRLVDENTAGTTTDDVTVSSLILDNTNYVRISTKPKVVLGQMSGTSKPTNVEQPDAPAQPNFAPALFLDNGNSHVVWSVRYMSDGRVVDSTGKITSTTLFLWTPLYDQKAMKADPQKDPDAAELSKVRAITVFGTTGMTKLWAYKGTGKDFVAK